MARGKLWTDEQMEIARRMVDEKASEEEFFAIVGHTKGSFFSKIQNGKRKERLLRASLDPHQRQVQTFSAPPELVEDARRRAVAARSITAFVCGDPPPGYSALDKRGQA